MLLDEAHKKGLIRESSSRTGEDPLVPAAITDAGCERDLNEDRYAVIESPSGLAWVVLDGMGGVTGGDLAAQLALDAMRRDLETLPARSPEEALRSCVLEANRIIVLRRQNPAFSQMGTTVVSVLFALPEVVIGHAGDSRAYLIRENAIQQLTTDHTYVQELVNKGQLSQQEALSHPDAHILTRCIGSEPGLAIDLQRYWIWSSEKGESQDVLLLCTDGLYSQVSDSEIAQTVSNNSPQRACAKLVQLVKERGGYDNITLTIIPLGGRLKEQAPPNYVEEKKQQATRKEFRAQAQRQEKKTRSGWRVGKLIRDILIAGTLTAMAVLLTTLVFFLVNAG